MVRKEPSGRSVGLRYGDIQAFSDSLRRRILRSSQARSSRKFATEKWPPGRCITQDYSVRW
jgi:hypothetical protein